MVAGELAKVISGKPVSVSDNKFVMKDLGSDGSVPQTQTLDVLTCEAVVEGFGKVIPDEADKDCS